MTAVNGLTQTLQKRIEATNTIRTLRNDQNSRTGRISWFVGGLGEFLCIRCLLCKSICQHKPSFLLGCSAADLRTNRVRLCETPELTWAGQRAFIGGPGSAALKPGMMR